ncbi:hypothetical protein PHMEG_00010426 [Phytophthora megakarya]|uniref:Uncharacterized protein n=1 Tax=Phytophthora megakarya TaxID=4795 RepID=A0A225WFH7_9STRA|nr:hypothetical protein PHMEG_00010426 [Phytophthora megakarya]
MAGFMMSLFGHCALASTLLGHDMTRCRLAEHMEKAMKRRSQVDDTDDAGQCSRARRILALRWSHLTFLKCFAHDVNNLVKIALCTSPFRGVTSQATEVVNALHASSSKWLVRAQEMMIQTYGCEPLRVFATKYRDDSLFPESLSCLEHPTFWQELRNVEVAVNPLCCALFKLQSDENTLADVVIVFRELYDGFVTGNYANELIPLFEELIEITLFIVALNLHPAYNDTHKALPLTAEVTNLDNIGIFAKFYYSKLLRGDPGSIVGEMTQWLNGEFTDLSLDDFQELSLPPRSAS